MALQNTNKKILSKNSVLSNNHSIMQALSTVFDVLLLNILFILGCVPVLTFGPSVTALYSVTMKIVRREDFDGIFKTFVKEFRKDFLKSLILGIIALIIGFVLAANYFIIKQADIKASWLYYIVWWCGFLIYLFDISYLFPLHARFENRIIVTLYNAFLLSIANLIRTLVIVLINLLPFILAFFFTPLFISVSIIWILFGFAGGAYLNSILLNKIFQRYIMN